MTEHEAPGTDVARGEEAERDDSFEKKVDEAERRADEARDEAEEAVSREAEGRTVVEDAGGQAPELDQPEETPPARQ